MTAHEVVQPKRYTWDLVYVPPDLDQPQGWWITGRAPEVTDESDPLVTIHLSGQDSEIEAEVVARVAAFLNEQDGAA